MIKKVWFKVNDLQNKVGYVVDGWYDGIVQVKEQYETKIFLVAPDEMEFIKYVNSIEEDENTG